MIIKCNKNYYIYIANSYYIMVIRMIINHFQIEKIKIILQDQLNILLILKMEKEIYLIEKILDKDFKHMKLTNNNKIAVQKEILVVDKKKKYHIIYRK